MLQPNSAAFVVLILSQWLMAGIYNIHHSFMKALLCSQGCKSNTLLTFNVLHVVTLLYEFSTCEVSIIGRSCIHKSLTKHTNCCWAWALVLLTGGHLSPPTTHRLLCSPWPISLSSAPWLSCCRRGSETHSDPAKGRVLTARVPKRGELTCWQQDLKYSHLFPFSCTVIQLQTTRVSLFFRHQDT